MSSYLDEIGKTEQGAPAGGLVSPAEPGPIYQATPLLKTLTRPGEPEGWLELPHLEPAGWGLGPGDNQIFDFVRGPHGQPMGRLWNAKGEPAGFGDAARNLFHADDAGVALLRGEIATARVALCRSLRELVSAILWLAKVTLAQRGNEGLCPVLAISDGFEALARVNWPKGIRWLVTDRMLEGYVVDELWGATIPGPWL